MKDSLLQNFTRLSSISMSGLGVYSDENFHFTYSTTYHAAQLVGAACCSIINKVQKLAEGDKTFQVHH
jgi:hypothetical protein